MFFLYSSVHCSVCFTNQYISMKTACKYTSGNWWKRPTGVLRLARFRGNLISQGGAENKCRFRARSANNAFSAVDYPSKSLRASLPIISKTLRISFIEDCFQHGRTIIKAMRTSCVQLPHSNHVEETTHKYSRSIENFKCAKILDKSEKKTLKSACRKTIAKINMYSVWLNYSFHLQIFKAKINHTGLS